MNKNQCHVEFICYQKCDCVYSTAKQKKDCKYCKINAYDDFICTSKVAQVNRMTFELKKLREAAKKLSEIKPVYVPFEVLGEIKGFETE